MDIPKPTEPSAAAKRRFHFFRQFGINIVAALLLVGTSLAIGTAGYRFYAGMDWTDAFANAAMIVSGMGPLDALNTDPARLFAACFALYAGVALIATTGLVVAPMLQSFVQRLHVARGGGSAIENRVDRAAGSIGALSGIGAARPGPISGAPQ